MIYGFGIAFIVLSPFFITRKNITDAAIPLIGCYFPFNIFLNFHWVIKY